MAVDAEHRTYQIAKGRWKKCRDAYEGSDAVKAAGIAYLPPLDSHKRYPEKYDAYKLRALFYNATARTVNGLTSVIFQKPPTWDVDKTVAPQLEDVTLGGVNADLFSLGIAIEVMLMGRHGVLVEWSDALKRPYWCSYDAETIINWTVDIYEGDLVLKRVVLRECIDIPDVKDPFSYVEVVRYRVLSLEDGQYRQVLYKQANEVNRSGSWVADAPIIPERRGKPLNFIPFIFINPTSVTSMLEKPPLLDLVEINLSHYRTMADLEHGRHFTALPTPWVSGARDPEGPLSIGSSVAWELDKGGQAGMLEFSGAGLNALVTAEQDKRKMMGTQGARLLDDQSGATETATAIIMRYAGDHATVKTIAQVLEQALTIVVRWHVWWLGTEEKPEDVDASCELNKDFFAVRMNPNELQGQLTALQAEAISYKTFYYNLTRGDLVRPGISAETEREEIARQQPMGPELPPVVQDAGPGIEPGDIVVQDEGPYKIVKRGGRWLVIKADDGHVMGTHVTREHATKQVAALHTNVKESY